MSMYLILGLGLLAVIFLVWLFMRADRGSSPLASEGFIDLIINVVCAVIASIFD